MRPNVSRIDDVNNAAALISATPIISAEAVRAVRRGDRIALSRANLPGVPNSLLDRRADQPGDRAGDGRREAGDADEDQQRAAAGEWRSGRTCRPGVTNSPITNSAAPTSGDDHADDQSAAGADRGEADLRSHRRDRRDLRGAPRREHDARHRDADADDQRDDHRRAAAGSATRTGNPAPLALNTAMISLATPNPAEDPEHGRGERDDQRLEHDQPPDLLACWRRRPRISASSRRRWPIVMPNTLLMMNAATNVVMKAKIRSPVPKIEMIALIESDASSPTCSPVTTSVRGGSTCSIAGLHGGEVGAVGDA